MQIRQPYLPFKEEVKKFLLQSPQGAVRYGIGGAYVGRSPDYRATLKEDLLTLETAYGLGFRYYDTAPAYANSEWTVGEFVARVPRESIFLATKFNLKPGITPSQAAEHTRRSLEESLRRLKTDTLDLFQVHDTRDLSNVLAEGGALEALLEVKRQGLVRYIGVANRPHPLLEEGARYGAFDTILTYSDFTPYRQSAAGLIRLAGELGIGVINASPLAGIREHKLDFHDPKILAESLLFPLGNPGIDINLTGPGSRREVLSTMEALRRNGRSEPDGTPV